MDKFKEETKPIEPGLDSITASIASPKTEDELTQSERHAWDEERRVALDAKKISNQSAKNDNIARVVFAVFIAMLTVAWLVAVLCITISCGRGHIQLDSSVLLALVGSASANVLGFFHSVTGYLFPKRH